MKTLILKSVVLGLSFVMTSSLLANEAIDLKEATLKQQGTLVAARFPIAMNTLDVLGARSNLTHSISLTGSESIPFDGDVQFQYHVTPSQPLVAMRVRGGSKGVINDRTQWQAQMALAGQSSFAANSVSDIRLWVDSAVLSYRYSDELQLQAGKVANPYKLNSGYDLFWDEDLTFEGVTARYDMNVSQDTHISFTGSAFLREASNVLTRGSDYLSNLHRVEGVDMEYHLGHALIAGAVEATMFHDEYNLNARLALFGMNARDLNAEDYELISQAPLAAQGGMNTEYSNYAILDILLGMDIKTLTMPVSLSVQILQNFAAEGSAMGYVIGGRLGDENKVNSIAAGYHRFSSSGHINMARYVDSNSGDWNAYYAGHHFELSYLVNPKMGIKGEYTHRDDSNHALFASVFMNI